MTLTKRWMAVIFFIATVLTFYSFKGGYELPTGWFTAGPDKASYDMGIDIGAGKDGKNAATIKSKEDKITGFGTLMQNCLPDKYSGKRVRMSALVKTKNVTTWAGIWLQIDQKNSSEPLAFDNLHDGKKDRSIKGTTDWTKYEIVLDVPRNASNMSYGGLLVGTGQIWFTNLNFEIVDNSVPTTGTGKDNLTPNKEPSNLNFDK